MLALPAHAFAATPTEAVKPFYDHPGLELDPAERGRFADPALKVLESDEALRKSGEGDCLDPNMAFDAPTFDKAEVDRTLKMVESVNGDEARVIVAFTVSAEPRRLEWKLKKIGDDWKIVDVLSVTGEWALSQYNCN